MTTILPATVMSTEHVNGAAGGQSFPAEESTGPSDVEDVGPDKSGGTGWRNDSATEQGCADNVPNRLNTESKMPQELQTAKSIEQVPEYVTEQCHVETAEANMDRPEGPPQAEGGDVSGGPPGHEVQEQSAENQPDDPLAAHLLSISTSTSVSSSLSNLHQVSDAAFCQQPSQEEEVPNRESRPLPTPWSARETNQLQEIRARVEQLQEDNQKRSEIPDESDLSYEEQGSVREKFRTTAASIEKTLFELQEAEELSRFLAVSNRKLQKDLQNERQYGEKLRQLQERVRNSKASLSEAEHLFQYACGFKRSKIPLNIGLLRTVLPADITKDIATLKEFIKSNFVTARFAQIAFAGLPYTGKSTLFKRIVGDTTTDRDLTIQEAVLLQHDTAGFWRWLCSDKEDAELIAILGALAQITPEVCTIPDLDTLEKESAKCVGHDAHLERTLRRLQQVMKTKDVLFHLKNSILTFVNIWDVGVSKPAFELLPILAPDVQNLILVNLIHLARDALPDTLEKPPQLHNEELYFKRYHDCGNLLIRRSVLHYYLRCVPPSCQALLVGTHGEKLSESYRSAILENLQRRIQQKAREMHVEGAISNTEILAVNVDDPDDAERVKKAVEKLILDERYKETVPLSWIFLRCALLGRMYIRKEELIDISEKCGLRSIQELDDWIELFQSCLSIICLSRKLTGFSDDDYIVLDPLKFFRGLNQLYFADQQPGIPDELSEDVEYVKHGILPDALLRHVCRVEEDSCNLYLGLLQSLGFLMQVDTPVQGYFFPSLRREHCPGNKMRSASSLFIRYPKEVPFDNQVILFRKFVEHCKPGKIEIGIEKCYNVLLFHWSDESGGTADIRIRFLLCFAEVSVSATAGLQPNFAHRVKSACVEAFEVTKQHNHHLEYNLALVCPNGACLKDENVFVNFGAQTSGLESLICPKCARNVGTGDRKLWAEAVYL